MNRVLVALAILTFGALPSVGAPSAGRGLGAGTSCAEYGEFYKKAQQETDNSFFSWAQGFMTGMNTVRIGEKQSFVDLGIMDQDAQIKWLHTYCDAHPLAIFMKAVVSLYSKQAVDQGVKF